MENRKETEEEVQTWINTLSPIGWIINALKKPKEKQANTDKSEDKP